MDDLTPYFPPLRAQCAPLGAQLRRAGAATASRFGLAALFGAYFPGLLVPAKKGAGSRQRELPRVAVFWAFLGQVRLRGASCRWALTRRQADAVAKGRAPPGDSTGAYCQARSALALPWLQTLFAALSRWFEPRTQGSWYGRVVRLIDATGFSMPETKANRRRWPYAGGQKPGCGFPTGKLVGLFCLHTGRLLAFVEGSWKAHDLTLTRKLLGWLQAGEVRVADRAYCGWFFLIQLLERKVDFVIRLPQARTVRSRRYRSWPGSLAKTAASARAIKTLLEKAAGKPDRAPGALSGAGAWVPHPKRDRRHLAARYQSVSRLGHRRALRPPLAGRTPLPPNQDQPRPRCLARPLAQHDRTRTGDARHRL